MEILEAFDLTESYRSAAELTGADHKTVKRYVELRAAGRSRLEPERRPSVIDPHLQKIEEWVERSKAKIRADFVHRKLVACGYQGSERTTRRAVHLAKRAYENGHRRVYRPWIPEPGMWFQFDWADGPKVRDRKTLLWCAWLSWSKYRVVIPTWDQSLPTVISCIDQTLRFFKGAPTYALTDNAKTVTVDRIAQIAVRHPMIVSAGVHYGMQIKTCRPADPESKGGVEATVRISTADLVPTDANLLEDYENFDALKTACDQFMVRVNSRAHKETRRAPAGMLIEERAHLHPIPDEPYAAAFGETRVVDEDCTIRYGSARYSVPHRLIGERVWVSVVGEDVVCVHLSRSGAQQVARHKLTTPGNPRIDSSHYPERQTDPLNPKPKAASAQEQAFLSIGPGAEQWLIEAAATGAQRVRAKMARAVELNTLVGQDLVDRALGRAAAAERFADSDLESIIEYLRIEQQVSSAFAAVVSTETTNDHSTSAWKELGR